MSTANRISFDQCGNRFQFEAQRSDIGRQDPRTTTFPITLRVMMNDGKHTRPQSIKVGLFVDGTFPEDGSGERWMFTGLIPRAKLNEDPFLMAIFGKTGGKLKGYIDVNSREGHIQPGFWTL